MERDRESFVKKLRESGKVDFLSTIDGGRTVFAMSKDKALVDSLEEKGAHVSWFDRTLFETRAGGEPRMQAEILMGESFFSKGET